jgi:hypothetical protein
MGLINWDKAKLIKRMAISTHVELDENKSTSYTEVATAIVSGKGYSFMSLSIHSAILS